MTTKLYWHWTTNPQKIRLALEEWSINHKLIQIHLGKGENRSAEYRSIHPKGSVPTLVYNNQVYWESNAALLALAQDHPELMPGTETADHAEALNLLFMEACTFVVSLVNFPCNSCISTGTLIFPLFVIVLLKLLYP